MMISKQIRRMRGMSLGELRDLYAEVFGEPTTSRHKQYLIKRIAWRLQANDHGGLSDRAVGRARELADVAELRLTAPTVPVPSAGRTVVRPAPQGGELVVGQRLNRVYKGQTIVVEIAENGVLWDGTLYRSLSAVAKKVTGSHWNGRHFFGLSKRTKS